MSTLVDIDALIADLDLMGRMAAAASRVRYQQGGATTAAILEAGLRVLAAHLEQEAAA